jgi:hypothetical protein
MIKNLDAAIKLVKDYRAVKKEDIEDVLGENEWDDPEEILRDVTGFGHKYSCPLCRGCNGECTLCIHSLDTEYFKLPKKDHEYPAPCIFHPTYDAICNAESVQQLLDALSARADYLETLIDKYDND